MKTNTLKELDNWSFVFAVLLGTSFAIGLLRVFGFKSESYQAIAHIFVGGLFGAALATGYRDYWVMAVSLTVVEIIVFLAGEFH